MTSNENNYSEDINLLTPESLKPLFDLIPEIEKTDKFGEWDYGNTSSENVVEEAICVPIPIVSKFLDIIYKSPLIIVFDWPSWTEGNRLLEKLDEHIDTMDLLTLCKLLTMIVRSDRFCEGCLVHEFESGKILMIIKAIRECILDSNKIKSFTNDFPEDLNEFIRNSGWIFAKTYADTWPHEYIVKEKVDSLLFEKFADYIENYGYWGHFYNTKQKYMDLDDFTYWHMDNIINRCDKKETYEVRRREGRLPSTR